MSRSVEAFKKRLSKVLQSFTIKEAELLASEIRGAEAIGYELFPQEDRMNESLLDKIQTEYARLKRKR